MKLSIVFAMLMFFVPAISQAAFPAKHTVENKMSTTTISQVSKWQPKVSKVEKQKSGKIFGIISLVAGILAILSWLLIMSLATGVIFSIIGFAVLAIVMGIIGASKPGSGLAITGLALGAVALIPMVLLIILFSMFF